VIRSFRSELIKLNRRGVLLGGCGTGMVVAILVTVGVWAVLPVEPAPGTGDIDAGASQLPLAVSAMTGPDGMLAGFRFVAPQLVLVAFCVAASGFGAENKHGTWRNLLVRQPDRPRLVAGKLMATTLFAAVSTLAFAVAAGAGAAVMAALRGAPVGEWLTPAGLGSATRTAGAAVVGAVLYGLVGACLGIVLRSAVAAISFGLGWFFVVEPALAAIVAATGATRLAWLPGEVVRDLIWQARPAAAALAAGWAAATALLGVAVFTRQDIRLHAT
jgi:hypothetical protein